MDSNGNQRKRGLRMNKNANANENSASQNLEQTEDKGISAVALSPTLEEPESVTNAPAAECRRSSRKKIIKFDVRDLLNKNRKTHKIQIEARIDSNAPTTSKAAQTSVLETTNLKASSVAREDLLSKQKTFLEKSAIFRRYSISQEHKPPPPPLPIPPLLGKSSDNKEVGLSGASSSRRLSRTQEFFSNVMIKPKQTSSLIVAQIESNTPCSVPAEKLKSTNMEVKNMTSSKIKIFQKVQQKRRGRPAKIKTQDSDEPLEIPCVQEKSAKKKTTPKKATNWKEYKDCQAQQSISTKKQKESCEIDEEPMLSPLQQHDQVHILNKKQEKEKHYNDALQSEISKSDDDGNFSGFQTSKDDLSCDSPILTKMSLEENISKGNKSAELCENTQNKADLNRGGIMADIKSRSSKDSTDNYSSIKKLTEADKILDNTPIPMDLKHEMQKPCRIESMEIEGEEKRTQDISCKQEFMIENLKTVKTDSKVNTKDKAEVNTKIQNQVETLNKATNNGTETRSLGNTGLIKLEENTPKEIKSELNKEAELQDVHSETKITNKNLTKIKRVELNREDIKVTTTNLTKNENIGTEISIPTTLRDQQKTMLKPEIQCKDSNQEECYMTTATTEASIKSKIIDDMHETGSKLESLNNSSKSTQMEENTDTKLSIADLMLLKKESLTQASTPSENTKSFSGTSSSSESDNISERSSYSSESFTTSSSPRSYKSGDVLKVTVKRISLPKRSSSSSQTSTSEEFSYSSVHMRKSPMAKRSKRLQKKFEKTFKNEYNTENIDSCLEQIPSNDNRNIDDLISNESVNMDYMPPKQTGVEETCLKNYKENCDYEVNKDTNKKKSIEDEKRTIFKIKVIEGSLPNTQAVTQDSDEILTHSEKNLKCEKSSIYDQSDNSKIIIERKKCKKIESEQHLKSPSAEKEQDFRTENKTELIMASDGLITKIRSEENTAITTRSTLDKEGISTEDSKVRGEMPTDLKFESGNLSEKIEAETSQSQQDKLIGKPKTTNQDKITEMTLAKTKIAKEGTAKKSKIKSEDLTELENEIYLKDANASVKVESLESTRNKTNSPIQMPSETVKIISTNIKPNYIKETNFIKKSIQPSRIELEKQKSISEALIIGLTETSKGKTKSYEKSVAADEEVNAEKSEKDHKNTSIKNKVNRDEIFAKEILTTDDSFTVGESDASLKKNSAKRNESILERIERKTSGRPRSRIKKPSEKLALIEEDVVSKNFENISEIITTESTQDGISVNNELKLIEASILQVDGENALYATKNSTAKCETGEGNLIKQSRDLEGDDNDILLEKSLEQIRSKHFINSEKDIVSSDDKNISGNRKELRGIIDSNIKEQFPTELTSYSPLSKTIQEACAPDNFTCENITRNQSFSSSKSPRKSLSQTFLKKSISSKHAAHSLEPNLANKSQEFENASETTQILKDKSSTNKQEENVLQKNKDKLLDRNEPVTKTRSRKSGVKNRYGLRCDLEIEKEIIPEKLQVEDKISPKLKMEKSELQQSPSTFLETYENVSKAQEDEIIQEQLKIENKIPPIEKTEKIEKQSTSTFLEADGNICQTKEKLVEDTIGEESVSLQENSQGNLLSSQIKNVSIETNTLLDILRTVQSNTEAALKASKSPIHMDRIENEVGTKKQELCIIQSGLKSISPTEFNIERPLTVKKVNLSPARSETSSPLSLKRVINSPTRSNSLSPLTLKKVTRRYERRSHHGEDCIHKTLEETFAEIAEQSSKAVLTAKEFDINDEQTAGEKFEKRLDNIDTGLTVENKQLNENFATLHRTTDLKEMPFNTKRQVDEYSLLDTVVSKEEISTCETKNVITVEAASVIPAKRGRKPKNRLIEFPIVETKETVEIKKSPKAKAETTVTNESGKMITITPETPKMANVETNFGNQINKSSVNDTLKDTQSSKLVEETTENLLISTNNSFVDSKLSPELSQTLGIGLLKPIEDVNESKSNKSNSKKREFKEAVEEDSLHYKGKEDEIQTTKQLTKKRDSSLNRSETKPVSKKLLKQNKNEEEEESLNLEKEDTIKKSVTTTPPQSKRGRKPKTQQLETIHHATGSKKNNKKEACTRTYDDTSVYKGKSLGSESDSLNSSFEKSFEEKLAKKRRQKKLKEAFETVIKDDSGKTKNDRQPEISSPSNISNIDMTSLNNSPPPENSQVIYNQEENEAIKPNCATAIEVEEDPDPLKDIEKFIADGVNLLKKDYKLEENSVDDVVHAAACQTTEIVEEDVETSNEENKPIFNTFETPADTPLNTPGATPPPKSPTSIEFTTPDENSGVRRSHRIKLITKTPKALVGRGLVRDKERFSIKDDVETKSHYTLDDHLMDLAEVEAKNAKFLKEMEERLSNFQVIKENEYLCERVISREARKMICDCFLTHEEEERGELGCGEDCLNRLLMIECGPDCNVKDRCTNKRFQKFLCSPCRVFRTEKKGFGIMADIEILPGEFIMEYVGEVIDTDEFEKRRIMYSQDKNRHYYFMALRSDAIIDATTKGNISRFINHSCDPNAETQKWTVNGELRIGFFSRKSIMPGEEITFNYQYQRYGREAQRCYCESTNCRGWIGQEPTSDEGEQVDDDDEYDESDDDEDADTSNLLVQDDDEDSDASVADPEEVQKQLEMAAAQAEAELAPLQLLEEKVSNVAITANESKSIQDLSKSDIEEDSKSKFKKLLSRMAEKVAAKQKQNKREQKLQRKKKSKETLELTNKLRFSEDPDIEDEVQFLKECGLKNQSDTLRLSRLMVRAKLVETRLNLLEILRKGDFPCRRLFLDYHGLRLLHGWMSEDAENMQIRLSLLQTLETLPIANKTVLTDSKVMQAVRNWCGTNTNLSPNEDSSNSSQDAPMQGTSTFAESSEMAELQKLALKLITTWEGLPEIFRIPKKERIEQMKEHEREADRQYAANAEIQENTFATDRYRRDRFNRGLNAPNSTPNRFVKPNPHRTITATTTNIKNLSKAERREMFEAKVARDAAEKRLAEERREFETKCRFFGLDPKKTRAQDIPFCVNPATGQWFSIERKPITTPPSYAHVQVPIKPKSTDPNDYQLPAVCNSLPKQWKYAITPQGKIYYYHIKHRIPQWEPPSSIQLEESGLDPKDDDSESEFTTTAGEDSSDDDDDILIGMDAAQLKAYIDRKVEMRRQKRYQRLVDERSISPRREEDRIYNQIEVRKYKENKEKIRKRKEDIRRKRAEALRQTSLNVSAPGNMTDANTNKLNTESDEELGALPIQDYLLSSDEEADLKAEVNSPLIDKIVEGDKIVDELDALTTKRQLKRPLPPHRDLSEPSTSSLSGSASVPITLTAKPEHKKRKLEKKEKRKPKEQDAKYRKNKEKFRCEIAGIIVRHLKPYRKETCTLGRIQSNDDFNHLARKLTHFVMIKELKYCESVGQTLVVTESVKSKSREFIKKYMAKYGDVYVKPNNDPDFKDIPFTL